MKKTAAFIALVAMSTTMFVACGKSETPQDNNQSTTKAETTAATQSTTKAETATQANTKAEATTQASTNKATEAATENKNQAGDVKVATLDDIKHTDFEYGIISQAATAKKLRIVQIESNTDTYCIAIENPTDDDIKVSFLREDSAGYTVGVYAHQIRVINTNLPKSSPFPYHNITTVSLMQSNQRVLDKFTTTFKRGSGNDLIVEFEATKAGDKLMGNMTYNIVKDGVVYFPGVKCPIKSAGSVSLRVNKPASTTYKNNTSFDFVVVQYSDFDKSVV